MTVEAITTIAFVVGVIGYVLYTPKQKAAVTRTGTVAPIYREGYELIQAISAATSETQLVNLRLSIDRFIVIYQCDERYQETMDEIMDAYNQKKDQLHDLENLLLIAPTYQRNAKRN